MWQGVDWGGAWVGDGGLVGGLRRVRKGVISKMLHKLLVWKECKTKHHIWWPSCGSMRVCLGKAMGLG